MNSTQRRKVTRNPESEVILIATDVGGYRSNWEANEVYPLRVWCNKTFGSTWRVKMHWRTLTFTFRNPEDATFFSLR